MHALIKHARSFPERAAADGERLARLAAGQAPLALFISCSDSRVVPSLITGARPGELFELRTAGGIVPRYCLDNPSGEAATIEFAVESLGVADIVVCGHSHCAAVGAMVRGDDLAAVPAMSGWLTRAAADGPAADADGSPVSAAPVSAARNGEAADLDREIQRHVLTQLERLRGYPAIRQRLGQGRIGLHGWFYEVHTGTVHAHRPGHDAFRPL